MDARTLERYWAKVDRRADSECWPWMGARISAGYGHLAVNGKPTGAHRVSYEITHGPIAAGLHIDHLCRNPWCVNPAHLEAVTPRENTRRGRNHVAVNIAKTRCLRGHEFDRVDARGWRQCSICRGIARRKYAAARKSVAA